MQTKASLEQRAITVITTSGVLVTLAFGFAAAITKAQNFKNFTEEERVLLVAALSLFCIAALIALLINVPKSYDSPAISDMLAGATPKAILANRVLAAVDNAREINNRRASSLALAFAAQMLAVLVLAIAVGVVTL